MLVQIALLALATYWVSSAFGWNPWTVGIVLGVLWGGYRLARHFGWFGMSPAPARTAGGGSGITAGMRKFVIGFSTLTFVMMVGTKVIGVSNNFAFTYFLGLGPRPWLYPGVTTDLLIWVALFFLSLVIAVLTANGRAKPAIWVFGITLVFLFVVREMPRTSEAARPKAAKPMAVTPIPAPTTKWEEADQAASEGRGMAPVIVETTKKAIVGDNVAKRSGTLLRETVDGFLEGLFPSASATSTAPPAPPVAYAAPVIVKVGKQRIRHPYGSDGCYTEDVKSYEWSWYLVGTGEVEVTTPLGEVFTDRPGKKFTGDYQPGPWKWCRLSLDATDVEIWQ